MPSAQGLPVTGSLAALGMTVCGLRGMMALTVTGSFASLRMTAWGCSG